MWQQHTSLHLPSTHFRCSFLPSAASLMQSERSRTDPTSQPYSLSFSRLSPSPVESGSRCKTWWAPWREERPSDREGKCPSSVRGWYLSCGNQNRSLGMWSLSMCPFDRKLSQCLGCYNDIIGLTPTSSPSSPVHPGAGLQTSESGGQTGVKLEHVWFPLYTFCLSTVGGSLYSI